MTDGCRTTTAADSPQLSAEGGDFLLELFEAGLGGDKRRSGGSDERGGDLDRSVVWLHECEGSVPG